MLWITFFQIWNFHRKKRIKRFEISKWQNFHLKLEKNSWSSLRMIGGGLWSLIVWALTKHQLSRISALGTQATARWVRKLPLAKNSRFSLTPSKTKTRSAWLNCTHKMRHKKTLLLKLNCTPKVRFFLSNFWGAVPIEVFSVYLKWQLPCEST